MLNLQICTVIIMTKKDKKINTLKNKKKKKKKKLCHSRDSNPGHMGSKSPKISINIHGGLCKIQFKIINIYA